MFFSQIVLLGNKSLCAFKGTNIPSLVLPGCVGGKFYWQAPCLSVCLTCLFVLYACACVRAQGLRQVWLVCGRSMQLTDSALSLMKGEVARWNSAICHSTPLLIHFAAGHCAQCHINWLGLMGKDSRRGENIFLSLSCLSPRSALPLRPATGSLRLQMAKFYKRRVCGGGGSGGTWPCWRMQLRFPSSVRGVVTNHSSRALWLHCEGALWGNKPASSARSEAV